MQGCCDFATHLLSLPYGQERCVCKWDSRTSERAQAGTAVFVSSDHAHAQQCSAADSSRQALNYFELHGMVQVYEQDLERNYYLIRELLLELNVQIGQHGLPDQKEYTVASLRHCV